MHLVRGRISLEFTVEVNSKDFNLQSNNDVKIMIQDIIGNYSELVEIPIETTNGVLNVKIHSSEAISDDVENISGKHEGEGH